MHVARMHSLTSDKVLLNLSDVQANLDVIEHMLMIFGALLPIHTPSLRCMASAHQLSCSAPALFNHSVAPQMHLVIDEGMSQ